MPLNTASAVINFYSTLEDRISAFYDRLSENPKTSPVKETLLALAKENRAHKELVERAYREVITDALEACFAFTMNEDDYTMDAVVPDNATFSEIIKKAVKIEESSHKFCVDASEKSKSLMSDVTQAFARVARKKLARISKLESIAEG